MDPDWTASALFSPSKARVQQAQAKDWAAVDAWVSKKYGSRLPAFERNEDTLQALLTLANLSESADEQRGQVERIEKAALQALSRRHGGITDEVLHAMKVNLASETHFDTLAEVVVVSDSPRADSSVVARQAIDLTSSKFEMAQQLERTQNQLNALKLEQARLKQLLDELKSEDFQPPADVVENTTAWVKTTKHLKAKVAEYEDRLSASRPTSGTHGPEHVQKKTESVARQRAQMVTLEAQLKAFKDLPTDSRAARRQLEAARDNLRKLTEKRERLFEGMVDT